MERTPPLQCQGHRGALGVFVNLTAKLYFRLARIKDALRFIGLQPDILDDVLDFRRASENAVLENGAAFGYLRGMGVHRL